MCFTVPLALSVQEKKKKSNFAKGSGTKRLRHAKVLELFSSNIYATQKSLAVLLVCFGPFDPEEDRTQIIRNVGTYLLNDTASYPGRLPSAVRAVLTCVEQFRVTAALPVIALPSVLAAYL